MKSDLILGRDGNSKIALIGLVENVPREHSGDWVSENIFFSGTVKNQGYYQGSVWGCCLTGVKGIF